MASGNDSPKKSLPWAIFIRRGVGIALLLFIAWAWLDDRLLACTTSDGVELCQPLGLVSIPAVAGALVLAILLIPDFSELSVPQLFSLKTRVDTQERRMEAQDAAIASLATSISSSSSVTNVYFTTADSKRLEEEEGRVTAAIDGATPPPLAPAGNTDRASAARLELLSVSEQLTELVRDVRGGQAPLPESWSMADLMGVVGAVRRARNSVAHDVAVDDEDVFRALAMGRALLVLLGRGASRS